MTSFVRAAMVDNLYIPHSSHQGPLDFNSSGWLDARLNGGESYADENSNNRKSEKRPSPHRT